MKTGNLIFLSGAASLAIAVIGTFSAVHAGTVERVNKGGYFICVRSGLTPDVIDWRCDVPQPNAANVSAVAEPEPEPEPEQCSKLDHHGEKRGKHDRFARR